MKGQKKEEISNVFLGHRDFESREIPSFVNSMREIQGVSKDGED